MGQLSKARRIVLLVAGLCLLIIVMGQIYGPAREKYKAYKQEARQEAAIKQALEEVTPPAHTKITIEIVNSSNALVALGTYWTGLGCTDVFAHYSKELPKHGFTLSHAGNLDPENPGLSFSSPDYYAWLPCRQSDQPIHAYELNLWKPRHA